MALSRDRSTARPSRPVRREPRFQVPKDARVERPRPESLRPFFEPKTIAVIGASRTPGKWGHTVLRNIVSGGFGGRVFPVNPNAVEVLGLPCYASVRDLPEPAELAIVVLPAEQVLGAVEECAEAGVKGLIVISSGFAEIGQTDLQDRLVSICRRAGIRLLGPNVFGVVNTAAHLNATFGLPTTLKGGTALITQSGVLGLALMGKAVHDVFGLSVIVSVGNKADVDDADLMEYLATDSATRMIVLYLEGFRDGRRFLDVARTVSRIKPIVAIKAGRTPRGSIAAQSHTAALAGSDQVTDAVFRQAGVLRASTIEEAFGWSRVLADSPPPNGRAAVIVTNGGGAGVVATDACDLNGVPLFDDSVVLKGIFGRFVPPYGSCSNPVDLTGQGGPQDFLEAIRAALSDDRLGPLIGIYCELPHVDAMAMADAFQHMCKDRPDRPAVFVFIGGETLRKAARLMNSKGIPTYEDPGEAVAALGALYRWDQRRHRPTTRAVMPAMDHEAIHGLIDDARAGREVQLPLPRAMALLQAAGIPAVRSSLATDVRKCLAACDAIGYPVVLKVVSPDVVHKTEIGGVATDVRTPDEAREAYDCLLMRTETLAPDARVDGILVNEMVMDGTEVILGASRDSVFGPVVMFGLGGIGVEVLRDVSFRVAPVTIQEAREMVEEIRSASVLEAFRGRGPRDKDALARGLVRLGAVMVQHPQIAEIDLNPVMAMESGCVAVDARVVLTSSDRN